MKLYTSKVVSQWIGVTERRVRQLRDEGVIDEVQPGLYDLRVTVLRYISYVRNGTGKADLNTERALLTRAKREAAETENRLQQGLYLETEDVERALKDMLLNFRNKILVIPAKLSPELAALQGNQEKIFDRLKSELEEALDTLSRYGEIINPPECGTDGEEAEPDAEENAGYAGEEHGSTEAAAAPDGIRMG